MFLMSNTKEIKNFLEKMFKNSAKSYGYKVISGIPYKEINGALFDIILQTSTSKDGVQMRCSLHYKPLYGGIEPITLIMDTTQITTIIQIQPIMKCGQVVQEIIVEHGKIAPILFRNA